MLHRIPSDPKLAPMVQAIEACTHCGLCLPACPTFAETRREAESPRGRIALMQLGLEQGAPLSEIQPHLDACIRCRACEPACPAQVPYHDLLLRYQDHTRSRGRPSAGSPILRSVLQTALPHAGWFRFFAAGASLVRPFREFLGEPARAALDFLPHPLPPRRDLPTAYAGRGERKGIVALLPGCVASVLEPGIAQAAVEILTRNGFDVLLPDRPSCCGAVLLSLDDPEGARRAATAYLDWLPAGLAAVVSTSAFCAAGLKDYPLLFAGTAREEKSRWVAAHALDVCAFLDSVDHRPLPPLEEPVRAAYHEACHLRRTPGFADPARKLLRQVSGLELTELEEPEICCGASGVYPIFESDIAKRLGRRRLRAFEKTGAQILISGDPGCIAQLRHHAAVAGEPVTILHTSEVLARAYLRQPLIPAKQPKNHAVAHQRSTLPEKK